MPPGQEHTATAETSDCPSVDETVTPKRNRQDEVAPGAKAETPFCPRRPGARPAWLARTLSSIRGQRATRRCEEKSRLASTQASMLVYDLPMHLTSRGQHLGSVSSGSSQPYLARRDSKDPGESSQRPQAGARGRRRSACFPR